MATSLSEINAAATDVELRARFIAAAAEAGIDVPAAWVDRHMQQLVATPITDAGDTTASVYAYKVATYTPTPTPGADPAGVTDTYIRAAVAKLNSPATVG